MLVAIVVAYVATLPLLHPILAALGFKRIVLADAVFAALFLTAAAGRRRWLRPPSVRLCAAAAGPLLAIAASAALAGAQPFPDLARVAYSMAVLLLFAHLCLSKQDIDRVSWTWLVTAVAISLAGVWPSSVSPCSVRARTSSPAPVPPTSGPPSFGSNRRWVPTRWRCSFNRAWQSAST
jgi:hypothetical protein